MITFSKKLPRGYFYCFSERPLFDFHHAHQVHGDHILSTYQDGEKQKADGLYSSYEDQKILGIKTADCLPIVILGEQGYIHLHAGWRGVHSQIHLNDQVHQLNPYFCFIGPHIQKDSFTVTEEFKDHFPQSSHHFKKQKGHLTFNLFAQVQEDLKTSFPQIEILNCNLDTFKETKFHSYRRNKTEKRNWNIFTLTKL